MTGKTVRKYCKNKMKANKTPHLYEYINKSKNDMYLPEPNRTKNPEVTSISECSFLKYFRMHTQQFFLQAIIYKAKMRVQCIIQSSNANKYRQFMHLSLRVQCIILMLKKHSNFRNGECY